MTVMTVLPAGPGDAAAMAVLLAEMDRFYGADDVEPVADRVRQISDAVFSSPPAAHVLLAWDGSESGGPGGVLVLVARGGPDPVAVPERAVCR